MNCEKIWLDTKSRYMGTPLAGETRRYIFDPNPCIDKQCKITHVKVLNDDMVSVAKTLDNCLLLNMANDKTPGGDPRLVGAQEEDLFRRSNLFRYLTSKFYPIKDNVVLISTNVEFFSAGLRERYKEYSEPILLDIVSCPGIRNNAVGVRLTPIDTNRLRIKLHTLFQCAAQGGYKNLVLSALGCGGFRCPPEHVSMIFKEIIAQYDGCFEQIIFCIYDQNYPKCNYRIFKETLEN